MASRKVKVDDINQIWRGKVTVGGKPESIDLVKKPGMQGQDANTRLLQTTPPTQLMTNKMPQRLLVVIECPYMSEDVANLPRNIKYAEYCLGDSIRRGEAPILSNLLYKQVLNYRVAIEHDTALLSNMSWIAVADIVAVYADYGISPGMQAAINTAKLRMKKIEYRLLGKVVG